MSKSLIPLLNPVAPGESDKRSYINALLDPKVLASIRGSQINEYVTPIFKFLTPAEKDRFFKLWNEVQDCHTRVQEQNLDVQDAVPAVNRPGDAMLTTEAGEAIRGTGAKRFLGDQLIGQGSSNRRQRLVIGEPAPEAEDAPQAPTSRSLQSRVASSQTQAQVTYEQSLEEAVISNFFPSHLAAKPEEAVAHLKSTLFPLPLSTPVSPTSPLIQQLILLVQNRRLPPEQIALIQAVMPPQRQDGTPPQQNPPTTEHTVESSQQYGGDAGAQHYVAVSAAQRQMVPSAPRPLQQQLATAPSLPSRPSNSQVQPTPPTSPTSSFVQASKDIYQLRSRIALLEDHLSSPGLGRTEREKKEGRLDQARNQLQQIITSCFPDQQSGSTTSVVATGNPKLELPPQLALLNARTGAGNWGLVQS
ncbi:hypothetical protein P7C70_g8832, partial [Phenoliferia sp. Uapishka_3]